MAEGVYGAEGKMLHLAGWVMKLSSPLSVSRFFAGERVRSRGQVQLQRGH